MPKVVSYEQELTNHAINELKVEMKDLNVTLDVTSEWLNCTPQNVCKHFKKGTLSLTQYLVIKDRLRKRRKCLES